MRRGEACALRRSDLDLDAGVVRKARAISQGVERATKTGARYALAIDDGTIKALHAHLLDMDDRAADSTYIARPGLFRVLQRTRLFPPMAPRRRDAM
jgi:integrase